MTAADAAVEGDAARRYWILATVTLVTMLFAMTVTISYVVLPQMQGSLSATQDQIAWTVTFNLVATAVGTPASGWLANRFGRRALMFWCVTGFSIASLLCGTATTLEELIFYRVMQGIMGAPITPLSQAIILSTFDRRQHSVATAIWGIGVVCGPIIGPTIGGFIAEAYNWRWVFFMTLPVCIVSILSVLVFITDKERSAGLRLDWTGFLALSIAVASFQLMLDRGERLDWFDSQEIIVEACVAGIGLYLFAVHSLTASKPFLDPKLLLDRNFTIGLFFAFAFGGLAFVPMVLLPTMLQDLHGYPDSIIGIVLAARGAGSMVGSVALVLLSGRLDPRIGLIIGFGSQAASGFQMAQFDLNVSMLDVMWTSAFQGFGNSFLWAPLTVIAFGNLPTEKLGEATAVFHLIRNLGSAIVISICVGVVIYSSGVSYSVISEFLNPYNEAFDWASVAGGWSLNSATGLAKLSGEVERQASMIGYINAFYVFSALAISVMPFIVFLKHHK
ncbi:MAG: DHA2 family efflux MFS transporter permease subunit [Pseudomonadota bacterium]|nr:DHA2 family efflux MFS transporter permease subunit [Pseudomonadota bacterium]